MFLTYTENQIIFIFFSHFFFIIDASNLVKCIQDLKKESEENKVKEIHYSTNNVLYKALDYTFLYTKILNEIEIIEPILFFNALNISFIGE